MTDRKSTIKFPTARNADRKLAPMPEVDPTKEAAAEAELSTQFHARSKIPAPASKVADADEGETTYNRAMRRKVKTTEDKILVRGPKEVIEMFRAYIEESGFRNAWGAIEHLILEDKKRQDK